MKKRLLLLISVFVALAVLVSCAPAQEPDKTEPAKPGSTESESVGQVETEPPQEKEDLTFAFIIPSLDANWYVEIVDSFKYAAEEVGVDVMVLPSDYDEAKEVSNIELCVTENVDALCMFSFNENGAGLAARKMEEAGIPLVVPDSVGEVLTKGADLMAAVDFDWYKMGELYAEWMYENTEGDFVIITGNFEHFPCIYVNQGMKDKSEELGKNKLLDIRDADYNPTKAADAAEDLISGGLDFETIFVMQEEMAAAVVRVLKNNGVLNNPYRVITQNGQDHGIEMVGSGDLAMTISSSPGLEGYLCFRLLYSQIHGKVNYQNEQLMVPIAVVDKEAADGRDPRVLVPWHRDPIFKELLEEYYPEVIWD